MKLEQRTTVLQLAVIDSFWQIIFETNVNVTKEPTIVSMSPSILLNESSTMLEPQRVHLNVTNPLFFSSIKSYALIQGRLYEVIAEGTSIYFDFDTGIISRNASRNTKTTNLPLVLKLEFDIEDTITPKVTSG